MSSRRRRERARPRRRVLDPSWAIGGACSGRAKAALTRSYGDTATPSRLRFRRPHQPTFRVGVSRGIRLHVQPLDGASIYSRSVLGASLTLSPPDLRNRHLARPRNPRPRTTRKVRVMFAAEGDGRAGAAGRTPPGRVLSALTATAARAQPRHLAALALDGSWRTSPGFGADVSLTPDIAEKKS
jgi:hypothetical protein